MIFATVGMNLFGGVIAQPHLGYGGEWPGFTQCTPSNVRLLFSLPAMDCVRAPGEWPAFDTFGGAMLIMLTMAT